CFIKVFGIIPGSVFNNFLNTVPGLFIVGGIFGTFLGIMKALPELSAMNLSDIEGSKIIMDTFLLKISFSMSTSIIGIILSVAMSFVNTFFSCERAYMDTVERLENQLDNIWNMSSNNKLPKEVPSFDADRDPIEVLSEDLITKELNVDIGFMTLTRPISRWWHKKSVDEDRREIKESYIEDHVEVSQEVTEEKKEIQSGEHEDEKAA